MRTLRSSIHQILSYLDKKRYKLSLKLFLDEILISYYPDQNLRILEIKGWFFTGRKDFIPDLILNMDHEKPIKIDLNIDRPDVTYAYEKTAFYNGFINTIILPDHIESINITENSSRKTLYTSFLNQISVREVSQADNKYLEIFNKIPNDTRNKLLNINPNVAIYLNEDSWDKIFYSILKLYARPTKNEKGYNVFAYVSGVFGLSEAARGFIDYLIENNEAFCLVDFLEDSHHRISSEEELRYLPYYYQELKYDTNVFLLDTLSIPMIRQRVPEIFENKKNMHAVWWEFETGFEDRVSIFNQFDEIIVFSDFIKKVMFTIKERDFKVTKIKYPFYPKWQITEEPEQVRSKYLLDNKFCFFFNFDYASGYNRKNPEASLKAFYKEFKDEEDTFFVFKTNKIAAFNEKVKHFNHLISKFELEHRVRIISDNLDKNEFMSLLNAMDCYVSLHRGEGLGLGILEAYTLGKAVIATNYGGNTEYMNHPLGHPVIFKRVPANDDYSVYNKVKEWAEPDIAHASVLMRKVYLEKKGTAKRLD